MQSLFSKLASMGVLALGLALVPATLPAQTSSAAGSGNQATAPAPSQNGNAANSTNSDQNGNAVNPNNNSNQAAVPPAGTPNTNSTDGNSGGGGWGLWGLVGLLGLFGLAKGRGRATSYVETRDRDRDINDRRVA